MIGAFLPVLEAGLSLWNNKEKHKYMEEFRDLKRTLAKQEALEPDSRDMLVYLAALNELQLLGEAFSAFVLKKDLPPQ